MSPSVSLIYVQHRHETQLHAITHSGLSRAVDFALNDCRTRDTAGQSLADAHWSPYHPVSDHCGFMSELLIGEKVTLNGRDYEILGLTSMSVRPRRVFLRDVETDEHVDVLAETIRFGRSTLSGSDERGDAGR